MTMDIHLQITLPDDCVTPNVPRIKASFFNRKFRDNQTPTTPKVSHARVKVTTSTKGRPRRNASNSAGISTRKPSSNTNSPYTTSRPAKGRSSIQEPFDLDFSTPRATRNLLTPPNTSRTKIGKNGRVTHLIYRPLELDNESSSESIDTRRKRLRTEQSKSPEINGLLAIEGPRASDDSLTEFVDISEAKGGTVKVDEPAPAVKLGEEEKQQRAEAEPPVESTEESKPRKAAVVKAESDNEEPEIIEVVPDLPEMPAFVPGNCNIEAVLKMFGKQDTSTLRMNKL